ncbi:MAG: ABC transporter substrate-binding protein [Rhodospirillales bacterium]|nr:MAG: ABC transporter substrate-binding protein [Rhodospirillales bacterium]
MIDIPRRATLALAAGAALSPLVARAQAAPAFRLPLLFPLTGFVALEGKSQRDGALLAIRDVAAVVRFAPEIIDTATSPEAAATAWQRAARDGARDGVRAPVAMMGPILGTQMLALLPQAAESKLPVLTVSGTARLSEMGNPWFFRFFPADGVVKVAHARYVLETLRARKPAIVFQTTAYGQSGREALAKAFAEAGTPAVLEEGVATTVNDFAPVIARERGRRRRVGAAPPLAVHRAGDPRRPRAGAGSADRRRLGDGAARHGGIVRAGRSQGRVRRDRRDAGGGDG